MFMNLQKTRSSLVCAFALIATVLISSCTKNRLSTAALSASKDGRLSRYDVFNYNNVGGAVPGLPAAGMVFSYDSSGRIGNVFLKLNSSLEGENLIYQNTQVSKIQSSTLASQTFQYDENGILHAIAYTTLSDTGQISYNYDDSRRLVTLIDSVKTANGRILKRRYDFSYGDDGNVSLIHQNELNSDNTFKRSREYFTYFQYDQQKNPFSSLPFSRADTLFPGREAALFNPNNVVSVKKTRILFKDLGNGTTNIVPDTVPLYQASRAYTYGAKGFPLTCHETYDDLQGSYQVQRNFKFTY